MAVKLGGEHNRVFRSRSVVFIVGVVRYESLGLHEAGLYEEMFGGGPWGSARCPFDKILSIEKPRRVLGEISVGVLLLLLLLLYPWLFVVGAVAKGL